jgi:hypothetical protein
LVSALPRLATVVVILPIDGWRAEEFECVIVLSPRTAHHHGGCRGRVESDP